MEIQDSYRYQEAVQRLKKLLYNGSFEPVSSHQSSHLEEKFSRYDSTHKDWLRDGGGRQSDAELVNNSGVSRNKLSNPSDGVWCLMELLRHQEELIAQLEKENEFLKREIISVSDGAKKAAQENQDLSRRLAKTLSQALAQDEATDSSISTSNSQAEKVPESIDKLQKEKTALLAEVNRLQSALDAMTEREQAALDKLRAALAIAEETQAFTTQVRASSESAIEELSGLLKATKEEGQELKRLLDEASKRTIRQDEEQEEWKSQQQKKVKLLEEEISDQNEHITRIEGEVREKGRQIVILKDDLQAAQAAKTRLETQLEEQRQHSKDAHARLDHIIMARGAEAATATTKARELEDRLSSARQDINRLLNTISSIAQGPGKIRDLQSTDDVKSEFLAAENQMSNLLSSLQDRHEEELQVLHNASAEQHKSVDALRQEIASMRQQMVDDNEKNWECLQKMGQILGVLNPEEVGSKVPEQVLADDKENKEADQNRISEKDNTEIYETGNHSGKNENGKGKVVPIKNGYQDQKRPSNLSEEELLLKEGEENTLKEGNTDTVMKPESEESETKEEPTKELDTSLNEKKSDEKGNKTSIPEETNKNGNEILSKAPLPDDSKNKNNETVNKTPFPEDLKEKGGEIQRKESLPNTDKIVIKVSPPDDAKDIDEIEDKVLLPKDTNEEKDDTVNKPFLPEDIKKKEDEIIEGLPEETKKEGDESVKKASLQDDSKTENTIVEAPIHSECNACLGWPVIMQVVGEALEDLKVDVDKQSTRLERMISTHNSQCNNCLKYQLFLGVAMYRINDLYHYSNSLGQRIDFLLHRIMTY